MKLKALLLCITTFLSLTAHSEITRHSHKLGTELKANSNVSKKIMMPGYCEIEIINRSFEPVLVSGRFIDGAYLDAFEIYPYEYPHYISLQYWGCQQGMYLNISNRYGYHIYSGYTPVYQTVIVHPLMNQKKSVANVQPKAG